MTPTVPQNARQCGPNDTTCANPKPSGEGPGRTRKSSRPITTIRGRNIMSSRCSPIRRGASIWAMCATTRWATWWPATARARVQCPPPDGLGRFRPAGRERRDPEQRQSDEVDLRQYRLDAGAVAVDGPLARLVARNRDLRSELLQAPAETVPRLPRRGPGRAQEVEGQLGPGRPDGARQRAGDRRPRLAFGRDRRAARTHAMVLQDHRLFGGSARKPRSARSLAGKSPPDAEELDRALGGPSRFAS